MALDLAAARTNMVENQVRTNDVTDLPIQDAMRVVRREAFCPPGRAYLAYAESVIEYAPGWFLMEPRDISKLLQALYPEPGERALAIAAPYAAALLARMGLDVTLLQPPGAAAEAAAAALEGQAVKLAAGDIADAACIGALCGAPFDLIVCEGSVPRAPQAWIGAIATGGRLAVVERAGPVGKARLYLRGEDGLPAGREVFDASPPMLKGFEPAAGFSF